MIFGFFNKISSEDVKEWKDNKNVEKLIKALKHHDHYIRYLASDALGKVGDNRAIDHLIIALSDKSIGVRKSAILSLGKIGATKSIPEIKKFLTDTDISVIHCVIKAMKLLHWAPETIEDKIKFNAFLIHDNEEDVILQGLKELSNIKSEQASKVIIENYSRFSNKIQLIAIEMLGNFDDTDTIDFLRTLLSIKNNEIILKTLESVERISSKKLTGQLVKLLDNYHVDIRKKAFEILNKIEFIPEVERDKAFYHLEEENIENFELLSESSLKYIHSFLDKHYKKRSKDGVNIETLRIVSVSIKKILFFLCRNFKLLRPNDIAEYLLIRPDDSFVSGKKIFQTGGVALMKSVFNIVKEKASQDVFKKISDSWQTIEEWQIEIQR